MSRGKPEPELCSVCGRPERSGRLCGLHQHRRAAGEPMVQPHDLVGVTPSGYGLLGIVERDETGVICHECGRWLGGLSWHIAKVHSMTQAEYREAHQLPAGVPLVSLGTSRIISEQSLARVDSPEWQRFAAARDASLPISQEMASAASRAAPAGTSAARAKRAASRFAGPRAGDEGRWDERLAAVVEFRQREGRAPRQHADAKAERVLAAWVSHQRRAALAGTLSERRRAMLIKAGVPLERDQRWTS